MSKLIVTLISIIAAVALPSLAFADEGGSVLGHKTGEPLSSIEQSLTEKGYAVKASHTVHEVIPDMPIYKLLAGQKSTDTIPIDKIFIASNLDPKNPTASVIFRRIVYKSGHGPSLEKVQLALADVMSANVSNQSNGLVNLYRWKDGKQKKEKPFSITGRCLNLISEMTADEIANFNFYKPLVLEHYYHSSHDEYLHYVAKCDKVSGAQIKMYKDTEIVKSIKVVLMDNELIEQGVVSFYELISENKAAYEEKLKTNRQLLLEQTPDPDL